MNNRTNSSKVGKMLKKRYILALSIIACLVLVSQVIIQVAIISQQDDSRVVNLAGRQRMLSQRINKAAFGLYISNDVVNQKRYLEELAFSLDLWTRSHVGLQKGNQELGLPGKNSDAVKRMFQAIDPQHKAIIVAAGEIQKLAASPAYDKQALLEKIKTIQDNEADFLKGMDAIVFQYDAESKEKIKKIKMIEIALLIVTFFTLSLEILYIFRPAQKQIERSIEEIEANKDTMNKIFETAPNAMLLIDEADFRIKKLNHLAQDILKISNEEMRSVDFKSMLGVNAGSNKEIIEQIFSGESVENLELILSTKENTSLVMLLSSNIIKYEEKSTIIMGLADITKLKAAEEVLRRYATIDEMTGLLNKRSGMLVLDNLFSHSKLHQNELSICFMDLDGLKFVNDNYGHEEGDFYIKTVASAISSSVNSQDSVFRYGGDEIVLILNNCARELGEKIAQRIDKNLKQASVEAGKPYKMHLSVGIAVLSEQEVETSEGLLSIADRAMYENKRKYKQSL